MRSVAVMSFLLVVFSLPLAKLRVAVGGVHPSPTEFLFLLTSAATAMAVLRGEIRLHWNPAFIVLLIYLAAMLASAFASAEPRRAWSGLALQFYGVSFAALAVTLIQSLNDMRRALLAWLGGAVVAGAVGTFSVIAFYIVGSLPAPWNWGLHSYGNLPTGNYVRVESTFDLPAVLCDYLTASLAILLVTQSLGWLRPQVFWLILALIGICALFTLTPGLGGIFLALGCWAFLSTKAKSRWAALVAGSGAAFAFVASATVTPILYPTAPFVMRLPILGVTVAPALRVLTWTASWHTFAQHPLLGIGVGLPVAGVPFLDPQNIQHYVTDAHNVYLQIAGQAGLFGLAAIILLIGWVARHASPIQLSQDSTLRVGLGLAWLNIFAYQGLVGSFDKERYVWLLLGLFIASLRLEPKNPRTDVRTS